MKKSNVKYYEIGGVTFSVEGFVSYEETAPYSLFAKEKVEPELRYVFSTVDTLPSPKGKKVFESSYYVAYADDEAIYRYIGFFKDGAALDPEYALAVIPKAEKDIVNVYIPKDRNVPMTASLIYRTLCLEQTLGRFGGIILHSSFIEVDGKAILFTAPSGVGKSTQAELWRKHRGAFVVNGDCTFIRKIDGVYTACGLPFSGTSGICHNKKIPLAAVVYLTQSKENKITKLKGREAFRVIYEGIKPSAWHKEEALQVMETVSEAASKIPVFKLDCLPDEGAVKALENALFE